MPSMTAALDGHGITFPLKGQKGADCNKELCLTPGCVSAGELQTHAFYTFTIYTFPLQVT